MLTSSRCDRRSAFVSSPLPTSFPTSGRRPAAASVDDSALAGQQPAAPDGAARRAAIGAGHAQGRRRQQPPGGADTEAGRRGGGEGAPGHAAQCVWHGAARPYADRAADFEQVGRVTARGGGGGRAERSVGLGTSAGKTAVLLALHLVACMSVHPTSTIWLRSHRCTRMRAYEPTAPRGSAGTSACRACPPPSWAWRR